MNYPFKCVLCFWAFFTASLIGHAQQGVNLAFYNVENLFDTVDNPLSADEEFTPNGSKQYNTERYQAKINALVKVMTESKLAKADAFGLCEVENKAVLKDLVQVQSLKSRKFKIVHFDSPDGRGIDCAFIYNSKRLKLLQSDTNRFSMPFAQRPNTRDQLHVLVQEKKSKKKLHVFVNHWPSRYGGEEASRPKRTLAAEALKTFIAEVCANDDYPVIIMGDLNDHPYNESVRETLGADSTLHENSKAFFNLSYNWYRLGLGTYNYRGQWGVLDQFIINKKALAPHGFIRTYFAEIIKEDFMLYTNDQGIQSPSRTYGGPNYYGGYSDHLPILLSLDFK